MNIDIGNVFQFDDGILVVTQMDKQTLKGKFKLFKTFAEADTWTHDLSLLQCQKWHIENCPVCKGIKND